MLAYLDRASNYRSSTRFDKESEVSIRIDVYV